MGLFRVIADAIYKEYDRRVKRASLITEYGASHHHHDDTHADETHHEDAHADEDEAEIVNLPRGTPVPTHAPVENQEPSTENQ
jgi:non-ribosomal peptide synthetase component F